jgi:hypothetical protein
MTDNNIMTPKDVGRAWKWFGRKEAYRKIQEVSSSEPVSMK